jgi:hypothetical protein
MPNKWLQNLMPNGCKCRTDSSKYRLVTNTEWLQMPNGNKWKVLPILQSKVMTYTFTLPTCVGAPNNKTKQHIYT